MVIGIVAGVISIGSLTYFGITCHSRYRVEKALEGSLPKDTYRQFFNGKSLSIKYPYPDDTFFQDDSERKTGFTVKKQLPEIEKNLNNLKRLTPGGKKYRKKILKDINQFIANYEKKEAHQSITYPGE